MKLLVVNYHYVEDRIYPYPGIHPVSPQKLEAQLKALGEVFTFVGEQDLLEALAGKKELPEHICLITFDDGLKCQYREALPVLRAQKVPALFFATTCPQAEGRAATVHKIHFLRAHVAPNEFLKEVEEAYKKETGASIPPLTSKEAALAQATYPYDPLPHQQLKFFLNQVLNQEMRERIIAAVFSKHVADEKQFCAELYMSKEELQALSREPLFAIGTHTHSHYSLRQLPQASLEREIQNSVKTLADMGVAVHSVSYPYGCPDDISPSVYKTAERQGLKLGFTMERAFNASLEKSLILARMDANDAVGGKSPVFSIEQGRLVLPDVTIAKRSLYFKE